MSGHHKHRPDHALPGGTGCGPGVEPGRVGWAARHCPVPGCGERIDPTRMMCRRDWYAVPRPLRDRVWATWRSGRGALRGDHRLVVRLAIAAAQDARRPAAAER